MKPTDSIHTLPVVLFIIFISTLILSYTYPRKSKHIATEDLTSGRPQKYLSLPIVKSGRLANQIFRIIDGYAIAKKLNRRFYLQINDGNCYFYDKWLERLDLIFPFLKQSFEIKKAGEEEGPVIIAKPREEGIHDFVESSQFINESAKYLQVSPFWGQAWAYFGEFDTEIRQLLRFSADIKKVGDNIIHEKKWTRQTFLCAHVRRTDFFAFNAQSELNVTVKMINFFLEKHELPNIGLFGDDNTFMKEVIENLERKSHHFASVYSEGMDFYLSSQLCSSFILTAPMSTFGFWLAYLADVPNVYFIDDGRGTRLEKNLNGHTFPPKWRAVQEIEGEFIVR